MPDEISKLPIPCLHSFNECLRVIFKILNYNLNTLLFE